MFITVEIPDSLLAEANAIAAREGRTLSDLVEEGLRAVVQSRSPKSSQPFRLRDGSFKGGRGLQPGVRWSDLASLAYDEEVREGCR